MTASWSSLQSMEPYRLLPRSAHTHSHTHTHTHTHTNTLKQTTTLIVQGIKRSSNDLLRHSFFFFFGVIVTPDHRSDYVALKEHLAFCFIG